jgi:hypothetical protein
MLLAPLDEDWPISAHCSHTGAPPIINETIGATADRRFENRDTPQLMPYAWSAPHGDLLSSASKLVVVEQLGPSQPLDAVHLRAVGSASTAPKQHIDNIDISLCCFAPQHPLLRQQVPILCGDPCVRRADCSEPHGLACQISALCDICV